MINFPTLEKEILEVWKREKIFKETLEKKSPKGNFIFYEGPPTANGRPGIHHVLTRAFKDIILRYKTMQGFHVDRKAGWDTHGLPVELEVEKKLGISGKKQIENIVPGDPHASIIKFNRLCKESVWTYKKDWEAMTDRVAFWLDLAHPYVTYENSYIETLWWIIKQVYTKGLLYEDYKIVPYCPRCGTSLSSHEVAQGYKDDTPDPSIYVKFLLSPEQAQRIEGHSISSGNNLYFLVWTTTPWTLPGNVALAVGEKVAYVKIRISPEQAQRIEGHSTSSGNKYEEKWILAKDRLSVITEPYEIIAELTGQDLIGMSYEPLYQTAKDKNNHDYKVYAADFVSTGDGTGIVHIAPAFGEDDNALGKKEQLSVLLTIDPEGKINVDVPGKGKFVKEADKDVIEDLRTRGLLYRNEIIKHTYPFCWRCATPLLYYAKISWWIKMSALRARLIANNEKINWVPAHLKEGRFGEWLRGIKDWAFSRERYWGTPLPIWRCKKCKAQKCVGSIADFPKSKNTYYILRHGEANSNTEGRVSSDRTASVHLTEKGKVQIKQITQTIKDKKIDLVIASDYARTRETAEIVSAMVHAPITYDPRLREMNFGEYDGLPIAEYLAKFPGGERERFDTTPRGGENLRHVLTREVQLIKELETKYTGKNILLVGHGDPLWVLEGAYKGQNPETLVQGLETNEYIENGALHELPVAELPLDTDGFLDLHRPYIDQIHFSCETCGGAMGRVTDVIDVWFDSGAMPFAQAHFPFAFTENQKSKIKMQNFGALSERDLKKLQNELAFPADYISEAIDQTRGWFYTMLAVATLLDHDVPPYKNVISVGHVLDSRGQKMSKSKGNIVVPSEVIEKFGVDALRLYFYTASQPGDPKRFDIKGVDEVLKKTLLILWNVFEFWKLYRPTNYSLQTTNSNNILDAWILAKLRVLTSETTNHLDKYEITEAGRELASFINDLSTWYVRRSRDRFKNEGQNKDAALQTLGNTLQTLALLLAPFTPFIAEKIYTEITGEKSVHLANWPEAKGKVDQNLLNQMDRARQVVSLVLEERAKSNIPIRQPLQKLTMQGIVFDDALTAIILDEVNVKEALQEVREGTLHVSLDTTITEELKQEGLARELVRQINSLRKESKLTINDFVALYYETPAEDLGTVFKKFGQAIQVNTLSKSLHQGHETVAFEKDLEIGGQKIWIGMRILPSA